MESASMKEWAESLVCRDWEIYWNSDEENADEPTKRKDKNGKDDDSQGSFIDDWYAGRVLEATVQEDGTVVVKVLFVGDEQIYEMELSPSKVRPSARGWIKRTTALLSRRHGELPPDTATPEDYRHIQSQQTVARHYEAIPSVTPSLEELHQVLELQRHVQAQMYLRSKLATIVNLHGSIKYIDGEPNPTEPLVNHLRECCGDLEHACNWYLRCWELLTTCFGQRSGQSSNESDCQPMDYETLLQEYLEYGKNCILNCATLDVESTTSKRRQLVSPQRRPKRRRKNNPGAPEGELDLEGDFRCTTLVNHFVQKLTQYDCWYLPVFAKMFQILSHSIVNPLVHWKHKANQILSRKDDLEGLVEDDDMSKEDDTMSIDSEVEHEKVFSYEDVEGCLDALAGDPVLSLVDLSEQENALQKKLQVIEETAMKVRALLERLADDTTAAPCEGAHKNETDVVLACLEAISQDLGSPENFCFNINPIGKAGASITREFLEGAIGWRRWLLDVQHAACTRERKCFVEDLVKRMDALPDLSGTDLDMGNLSERRAQGEQQVREFLAGLSDAVEVEEKYTIELEKADQQLSNLFTKTNVQEALRELETLPVLLLVEEKISLRQALMEWSEKAVESLPKDMSPIALPQLENLYHSLQLISKGESKYRAKLINKLRANEKIDSQIRNFVAQEAQLHDSNLLERVKRLHNLSSQWKERAESIIFALRMHGNASVKQSGPSLKLPAMVDMKRISDLLSEYDLLGVDMSGYTTTLIKVLDEAAQWASRLEINLTKDNLPMKERLEVLQQECQSRPKGLIMDPTRQVTETLVDLLEWYLRSKETLDRLNSAQLHSDEENGEQAFSDMLVAHVYPLLAEGIDIVELFSQGNKKMHVAKVEISLRYLHESFRIRRSARPFSRERIESHPLGSSLLNQMMKKDVDIKEGSPLTMYTWVDWHLSVMAFVRSVDERDGVKELATVPQAEILLASEPGLESSDDKYCVSFLGAHTSKDVRRLKLLIEEARHAESEIRELLSKSRDLRKGSLEKIDSIRQHLTEVKEHQTLFKERSSGNHGLLLDPSLETMLDHHGKVFTWIVRTFSYPFLYLDEASYSAPVEREASQQTRIPLDVLVSFFERLPSEEEVCIDDFALVSMRIRELHEAATKWQDEITRTTMLSNRGGKRRGQTYSPGKAEHETESSSKLQMEKMKQLAANPILSKVAMPREGAVNGILRNSEEFEMKLHAFLSMDFDGPHPDRAAYPSSHSLVGRKGEFILFRLTMGELFESVLESMNELSSIAENVHAETPEKITFEWIQRAVSWIEKMNDAVTADSPFKETDRKALILPEEKGRLILQSGREIFLEIPDDLKKTLSQHGIFVSTNKQDQSLKVVLKKDGAHHSVGGTVMRWCPILFECLRADLSRLDHFRKELEVIFQGFNAFYARIKDEPKEKEENLYQWFCYHERASALLDDGARSLVVAPKKTFVDAFNNLCATFRRILDTHSNPDLDKKFAKMWFMEGTSLLDDRFILLESLLYRKSVAGNQGENETIVGDETQNFRDICRNYLVTSLTEALKAIGFANLHEEFSPILLEGLCSIKGWEIEGEMFIKFQEHLGITRVSEDYRSKARNLKASLSDKNNLSLCLRILLGDISPTDLVKMSKDELASQRTKLERARAEKEFRSAANLTPGIDAECPRVAKVEKESQQSASGTSGSSGRPASILRHSKASFPQPATHSVTDDTLRSEGEENAMGSAPNEKKLESKAAIPHLSGVVRVPEDSSNLSPERLLMKLTKSRSAPPPPPPSLVTAFQQSTSEDSEDDDNNDYGRRIQNDSGGVEFRFESTHLRLSFNFYLYLEDETYRAIDRFLPSSLSEKGRVPGKEFSKFVSQKTSGSWITIPLRVEPITDQDDRESKRLRQAYEAKDRVPMISVNSDGNTKLFLVIPHFHDAAIAASKTSMISFVSRKSSYAVLLTKDSRFEG